jgi:uncharacterized protein (TIGR03905 family)
MRYQYKPKGVCSRLITVEEEDGRIVEAAFEGGCDGNLKGICRLVQGMETEAVIEKFAGLCCGARGTSCPDQLARALKLKKNSTAETA